MQLQLKALANVPPHWERTASLIWFSRRCVSPCVCRSQRRPISRMWSTEMAVVGRQQRRNSWCGHNWVTGSVCNLHTSAPPPSPHLLSLCLHSVRRRDGVCYGEGLTALSHISLNATLPAVTIRTEHMPKLGTTSEALFCSRSSPCFRPLQYRKVCIWCDCGSHLNRTEMWFCLADSNASQMDPITCLIVATSCPPICPPLRLGTLALRARWDNLIDTAGPLFIFKDF